MTSPLFQKEQSMQVYIAGTGKLATELIEKLSPRNDLFISRWPCESPPHARSIVIHAGSGREIGAIAQFCSSTFSVLLELSTGSSLEGIHPSFPIVLCPNTNILMLKFMCMLEQSGAMFKGCEIQITESHQASKTSLPGTAVQMANALGISESQITSVRNGLQQVSELHIPHEHLARHAFHHINIHDGPCAISMETRVYGDSPYASGVQQIIGAIDQRELQARVYSITEFIKNGWV